MASLCFGKMNDSRILFFATRFIAASLTAPVVALSVSLHHQFCLYDLTFDKRLWIMPSEQTLKHGWVCKKSEREHCSDPIVRVCAECHQPPVTQCLRDSWPASCLEMSRLGARWLEWIERSGIWHWNTRKLRCHADKRSKPNNICTKVYQKMEFKFSIIFVGQSWQTHLGHSLRPPQHHPKTRRHNQSVRL